jgi:hypothetical protein
MSENGEERIRVASQFLGHPKRQEVACYTKLLVEAVTLMSVHKKPAF